MKSLFIIIFVFFNLFSFSQIELSLLNGNKLQLEDFVKNDNEAYIEYRYKKNNGRLKKFYSDYSDIYSMKIDGIDTIFYQPEDSLSFSVEEMGDVVFGMRTANNDYKQHWWAFAAGATVGGASLWLPTYGAVKIVVPVAYLAGMVFVKPSKSFVYGKYPDYFGNKEFAYGFQRVARKKILLSTSFGMLVGLSVSGATLGIMSLVNK